MVIQTKRLEELSGVKQIANIREIFRLKLGMVSECVKQLPTAIYITQCAKIPLPLISLCGAWQSLSSEAGLQSSGQH